MAITDEGLKIVHCEQYVEQVQRISRTDVPCGHAPVFETPSLKPIGILFRWTIRLYDEETLLHSCIGEHCFTSQDIKDFTPEVIINLCEKSKNDFNDFYRKENVPFLISFEMSRETATDFVLDLYRPRSK